MDKEPRLQNTAKDTDVGNCEEIKITEGLGTGNKGIDDDKSMITETLDTVSKLMQKKKIIIIR